jgi:hypothetical protein
MGTRTPAPACSPRLSIDVPRRGPSGVAKSRSTRAKATPSRIHAGPVRPSVRCIPVSQAVATYSAPGQPSRAQSNRCWLKPMYGPQPLGPR